MNHITSPNEPFLSASDLAQATTTFSQGRWQIRARKLPISRAAAIDALTERLGIPVPEMIFGDNCLALRHVPTGWGLAFTAGDALDQVDKTGQGRLLVAYARDWAASRETSAVEGIQDVRPFDWSYSTTYRGTETPGYPPGRARAGGGDGGVGAGDGRPNGAPDDGDDDDAASSAQLPPLRLAPSDEATLPLALLRRRDPILFHDDVILYESELDDNGISFLRAKIRVMPQRLLLLSRLYMRLDQVVVRVRDTRVYVDFATDVVLREYTAREQRFDDVRRSLLLARGVAPDAVMAALRDADQVADLLPVVDHAMERVDLGAASTRTAREA